MYYTWSSNEDWTEKLIKGIQYRIWVGCSSSRNCPEPCSGTCHQWHRTVTTWVQVLLEHSTSCSNYIVNINFQRLAPIDPRMRMHLNLRDDDRSIEQVLYSHIKLHSVPVSINLLSIHTLQSTLENHTSSTSTDVYPTHPSYHARWPWAWSSDLLALLIQLCRLGTYLLLRKLLFKDRQVLWDRRPRGRMEVLNASSSVSTISGFLIKYTGLYGVLWWKDGKFGVLLLRHSRMSQAMGYWIWNESIFVRHPFFLSSFPSPVLFLFPLCISP